MTWRNLAIFIGAHFSYVTKIEEGNLLLEINRCGFPQGTREWGVLAAGGCCYPSPQCPDNVVA